MDTAWSPGVRIGSRHREPALAHRVIIKTSSSIHDVSAAHVVRELLDTTPIEAAVRQTGGPGEIRARSGAG